MGLWSHRLFTNLLSPPPRPRPTLALLILTTTEPVGRTRTGHLTDGSEVKRCRQSRREGGEDAGGPDILHMDGPSRHRADRAAPGMQAGMAGEAHTNILLPFLCPEGQKVPTQTSPEVMARCLPPHQRFPPRPPFRLIFPGSYNFLLTPPESGKTGPGAEINTQVVSKSGCSNPLSWCQQPPAKRRRLPGPNKEAGSSYPGTPREWSSWSSHSSSYRSGRLSWLQLFNNTLN